MAHTLSNVNGCTKKIAFSFENLDLSKQIQAALVKKQKESNLKGFRKGHAPLDMVQRLYGHQVETDAINAFIQSELFAVIQKENLRMVGYPTLENMKYDPLKSVTFDAVVEVFPEITLKNFSGLSFKKEAVSIKEEEIQDVKKSYIASRAQILEVNDPAATIKKGNIVLMNFQGEKADGSRPEDMKGQDYSLEIGSGQFIPGFEDGVVGMKKGAKQDLMLTFPADYPMAELQNAKVKFEVEILEIKEKVYPDFTDELAKEFKFESVADLETKTRERLVAQKERQSKEKLHQSVLEKLVAENSFDVPSTLVAQQENYLKEDMKKNFAYQGLQGKMVEEYLVKFGSELTKKADFQVRSGLILDTLAKKYNVEATESDFQNKLEEAAKQSGIDRKQVEEYYSQDKKLKSNLMYGIREEKTFEKVLAEVKVE